MIYKLRVKFIIMTMCIVTLVLGSIFALLFLTTKANFAQQSLDMMKSVAEGSYQVGEGGSKYFVLEMTESGPVISQNDSDFNLSDSDVATIADCAISAEKESDVIDDYALRYYRASEEQIVLADISGEQRTLKNLINAFVTIGPEAFFAFLAMSLVLSRWAVKPVETAWEDQRRFIADASHELKTPLTVIMTNAQLAAADDVVESQRKQFARNIETMAQQMKALIEQMLKLARSEDDSYDEKKTVFDCSAKFNQAALTYESVFFERGLRFETDIEDGINVYGHANDIKHIAEVLLDNAAKYCEENGAVEFTFKKTSDKACTLTVINDGSAMSQAEMDNLFKRFYRVDASRSRDGGFGLGLPIAKSIVDKHNGTIGVACENGKVIFTVTLKIHA